MFFEIIHNPDLEGWYSEITDSSGRLLHQTLVFNGAAGARKAAKDWIAADENKSD